MHALIGQAPGKNDGNNNRNNMRALSCRYCYFNLCVLGFCRVSRFRISLLKVFYSQSIVCMIRIRWLEETKLYVVFLISQNFPFEFLAISCNKLRGLVHDRPDINIHLRQGVNFEFASRSPKKGIINFLSLQNRIKPGSGRPSALKHSF